MVLEPWRPLGGVASVASIGATVVGYSYISHQVHSLAPPAVEGVQHILIKRVSWYPRYRATLPLSPKSGRLRPFSGQSLAPFLFPLAAICEAATSEAATSEAAIPL